ncbi:MAG TPA: ATP synthase F1 subunit gamma [Solirubrobacteraceae bacterium]|nr:ATP synthase F1 subunit gamma [Solirubrobacteraceae bacterium]
MPQSQRDVRNRIASVRNIQKITRAMEMVAAARLRRAEQRITALRPYANAIARMTRKAAQASGAGTATLPLLAERDPCERVAVLLVTGDRGLAGAFNSQVLRAGLRTAEEHRSLGRSVSFYASGRRGVSSLAFRGTEPEGAYVGFSDRPSFSDARRIAQDLIVAYSDRAVDLVEIVYNRYVSPLVQEVRREVLLPVAAAAVLDQAPGGLREEEHQQDGRPTPVDYEPDPAVILARLVPDYVEVSVFRSLLESTASEHGARMTAMRNASENAGELIGDLTLQMNRARQAEITQEILEVVAGAEGL